MPTGKLFGTDGIRGLSGSFPVNEPGSRKVGVAVADALGKNPSPLRVVVGRDTRQHGDLLQKEICGGLAARGAQTFSVGICPTPALAAFLLDSGADAGIMVSASHNPPGYNGFKIFNSQGFKIPESVEGEIEKNFEKLKGSDFGNADLKTARKDNAGGFKAYTSLLESSASGKRDFSGIKTVIDCANGAMFEIAPKVFEKTGAETKTVGCLPDGKNINTGCGSTETVLLEQTARRHGAAFGAAFDGDGDRVVFCDEKGNKVDGDLIIALFAREMLESGTLKKPRVVTTIMSNRGLDIFLENIGIEMVRAEVGDRHVADMMRKDAINFGGEKSGHFIFSDHSTSGDGLLAALLAGDIIKKKNKPFSQILPEIEMFPQILKNVRVSERKPFDRMFGLADARAKLEKQLGKGGRIHIRYSGTEPLARILVEGENGTGVSEATEEIAGIIERNLGTAEL